MAATFEKANTYVVAAPNIRDREVGGFNPLAPTRFPKKRPLSMSGFVVCAVSWPFGFRRGGVVWFATWI